MRKIHTAVRCPSQPNYGECTPEIRDTQCVFAILSITPRAGCASPSTIKALCYGIPGVGALRVDADCSNIRILYDGAVSAIEEIDRALQVLGLSIRHPDERPSSLCLVQAFRGAA